MAIKDTIENIQFGLNLIEQLQTMIISELFEPSAENPPKTEKACCIEESLAFINGQIDDIAKRMEVILDHIGVKKVRDERVEVALPDNRREV